jgi:2-aminoethylphosphonate-pyruvate transaminase
MPKNSRQTRQKVLFTPGPLTTSRTVKQAMMTDLGSRDEVFIEIVASIRQRLVEVADGDRETYAAVPMQGSGTFGLEAVLGSAVPPEGKLLVGVNGAYGRRLMTMADALGIEAQALAYPEDQPVSPQDVAAALAADPAVTHVCVCHCETTSGILNDIDAIARAVRDAGRVCFVDAMSSFGGIPFSLRQTPVDYLVSSSNKCIEGVPGFSFVIARLERLRETRGWARSLALDLLAQFEGLEKNGQFRFTPPTHAILAFHEALQVLDQEGGVEGRNQRYRDNHATLMQGMTAMGFRPYLAPEVQSPIITTFHYPRDDRFDFHEFYRALSDEGFVIYPGKVGATACFRIGCIGRICRGDITELLEAIRIYLAREHIDV